jgi:light-independent protochlorophyllide reductase subunit B
VHVQDFPARYSPQMGFEGANVIFDSWVHPLMMGLEEHLLSRCSADDFRVQRRDGGVASACPQPVGCL